VGCHPALRTCCTAMSANQDCRCLSLGSVEIALGFSAARQITNTKTVALINKLLRYSGGNDSVGIKTQQPGRGALHSP